MRPGDVNGIIVQIAWLPFMTQRVQALPNMKRVTFAMLQLRKDDDKTILRLGTIDWYITRLIHQSALVIER